MARFPLIALALALAGGAAAAQPLEENPYPSIVEESEEEEAQPPRKPPPAETPPLQDRPVMLRAGASHGWDSNVFRLPGRSEERIGTAYLGLSIDKPYAQQRFRLDITETAYRYDNFSHLDFEALDYLGAWSWRLGPRLGGALSAARTQSLASYVDFRDPTRRNVRTTENFALSADALLAGGWHALGGLIAVRDRFSVPFPEEGSYRAGGAEGGMKYVSPAANWVSLTLRVLDGQYERALDSQNRLDDGFRRAEAETAATWQASGKSTFAGRLTLVDYRSSNFAERDFSGAGAALRYLWLAAAKLSLTVDYGRSMDPWSEAAASHRVVERLALGTAWQLAARGALRLTVLRAQSDYRDPLPGFAGTQRRDLLRSAQLEAEWRLVRNGSLKASVQRYRQRSTDPAAAFSGSLFTVGASLLF